MRSLFLTLSLLLLARFDCAAVDSRGKESLLVEIHVTPRFIRQFTGRSEGIFATQRTASDIELQACAEGASPGEIPFAVLPINLGQKNEFRLHCDVGSVIDLFLEVGNGKYGKHKVCALKLLSPGERVVSIRCDESWVNINGIPLHPGDTFEIADVQRPEKEAIPAVPNSGQKIGDAFTQLKQLKELYDAGILTEDEYQSKREKLVGQL